MPLPEEVLNQLPDDLKNNESLAQFNDIAGLAKSYVETKSMMGNAVRLPGEHAGEADKKAFTDELISKVGNLMYKPDFAQPDQNDEFFRTLGWPEQADKYPAPEGVQLPEEVFSELREVAHASHMTPQQFVSLVTGMSERHNQVSQSQQGQVEEAWTALKNEWGMTFDNRTEAAKKINEQFYEGREFGNLTPDEVRALYSIHESMTGQGPQMTTTPQQPQGMTPEEAERQAEEIQRRIFGEEGEKMDASEKWRLAQERIKLLQTYVPRFRDA